MSDHFRRNGADIKGEEGSREPRVIRLEEPAEPAVQPYEFRGLRPEGKGEYAAVKAKYGALAATDPDRASRSRKDSRFSINPLLRDPLAVAEEEARVIDARVAERVQAIRDEITAIARTEGFEAGRSQGFEAARAEFRQEAAQRMAAFTGMIEEFERARERILAANERYLVELVFRIGKMLALKEIQADREYVARLARELIETTGVRENVRVQVSPRDFETAAMLKEGLEKQIAGLKNLAIEPSAEIRLGGCQVETEWNAVDGRLETQLEGIHRGLLGTKAEPGPGE
jgi:flagellar assembly protein FliH